jgi:hypothetical protein
VFGGTAPSLAAAVHRIGGDKITEQLAEGQCYKR